MRQKTLLFLLVAVSLGKAQNSNISPLSQGIKPHHKNVLTAVNEFDIQANQTLLDKLEYTYDDKTKRLLDITRLTNTGESIAVIEKSEVVYDDKGRVAQITEKIMHNGQFVRYRDRDSYKYDDHNNVIAITLENFDPDQNKFTLLDQFTLKYENPKTNKPTEINRIRYCSGTECANIKDTFEYDDEGLLRKHYKAVMNALREYTYDANKKVTGYIEYRNGNTFPTRKEEWHYDEKKENISQVITYSYNNDDVVTPAFKFEYEYDRNKPANETYSLKTVLAYTAEHNWYPNTHTMISSKNSYWDDWDKEYVYMKLIEYSYSPISTLSTEDIKDTTQKKITLTPNPVTNSFQLNTQSNDIKIYIYNTSGNLVKTFTKKQEQYDISSLPIGAYIVSITENGVKHNIKILKK